MCDRNLSMKKRLLHADTSSLNFALSCVLHSGRTSLNFRLMLTVYNTCRNWTYSVAFEFYTAPHAVLHSGCAKSDQRAHLLSMWKKSLKNFISSQNVVNWHPVSYGLPKLQLVTFLRLHTRDWEVILGRTILLLKLWKCTRKMFLASRWSRSRSSYAMVDPGRWYGVTDCVSPQTW